MLKEIIISIQAYFQAHRFIMQHRLWKWIFIPGILYALLFLIGMYYFWQSTDDAVNYINNITGLRSWVQQMQSSWLSFFFILGEIFLRLLMVMLYFSWFKYLFLIIGSPIFAYLSEKTAAIIEGKTFPFDGRQMAKDVVRGIRIALRNSLWQSVYLISLLIVSLIPIAGWLTPTIALLVECYYYGFSMLDYSCERHQQSAKASIDFISARKGLAIGNGLIFYLFHLIPILGWVLAPSYAVIAATLSLYPIEKIKKDL